jgi:hypothetical protein
VPTLGQVSRLVRVGLRADFWRFADEVVADPDEFLDELIMNGDESLKCSLGFLAEGRQYLARGFVRIKGAQIRWELPAEGNVVERLELCPSLIEPIQDLLSHGGKRLP